jgi:hypothetical protein
MRDDWLSLWGVVFLVIGLVVRARQRNFERDAPLVAEV